MPSLAQILSTRRLRGPETEPVVLVRRRIYVLPTRYGFVFALILLVMLLGSINYNNSMGYALTFLLAGMALISIFHTHQNLAQLYIRGLRSQPVFAGDEAVFTLSLEHNQRRARYAIWACAAGTEARVTDVAAHRAVELSLQRTAPQRGLLKLGPVKIYTEFPLGLLHAWSWIELDQTCVVYPPPDQDPGPARGAARRAGEHSNAGADGQEDFSGLRAYHPGDPPKHVAWKRYPRSGQLLTKQFADGTDDVLWLDWNTLDGLDPEARLARLCRWIINCHRDGVRYGLSIPGRRIAPDTGPAHYHRCLHALALFGKPDAAA